MKYSDCKTCMHCITKRELKPNMRRRSDYVVQHKCARLMRPINGIQLGQCPRYQDYREDSVKNAIPIPFEIPPAS
ncbi:hypothetical protein FACS1894186_5860 [Alphaproteobacteria bacterium]|nr:hypothetical protein FACS1894186_5860 [Alphaproteobacteria bacterium]